MTAPTVTATLLFQRWEGDTAVTSQRKDVTIPHDWLKEANRDFLRSCAKRGQSDPVVYALGLLNCHTGPFELVFHIPATIPGDKNTLELWLDATEPDTGTQGKPNPVFDLIDQAAELLSSAGGKDPGSNYVFSLPETETAEEDMTLALQLIRRAQDRLTAWMEGDLRALAADLIHRFGSGSADQEGMDDDYREAANAEFPDLTPIDPGQLDEVRDYMRAAVIEIDGTRFNDEDAQKASHGITLDHVGGRLKQPQGPHGPA